SGSRVDDRRGNYYRQWVGDATSGGISQGGRHGRVVGLRPGGGVDGRTSRVALENHPARGKLNSPAWCRSDLAPVTMMTMVAVNMSAPLSQAACCTNPTIR